MDRRAFIGTISAVFVGAPWVVTAQSVTPRRIGFISNGSRTAVSPPQAQAFRQGLRALGWIEGQNVTIEDRWAEGDPNLLPALLADLVKSRVDVIMLSGTPAIRAAEKVTTTIPIVFVVLTDPANLGLVSSLARPGGNVTGVASQFEELIAKQLQLLKEALPGLSRVGLLHQPGTPSPVLIAAEAAARRMGVATRGFGVADPAEFENAFKLTSRERDSAMLVLPSPYFETQHPRLIELAARYRVPACYELRNYVQDGGLMSYGPDINAMFARAASYVDRILKGSKPGDLPIEQPSKFELVINLATAKALGLTIPQPLLLRADEVIK
jgi:ABC-type uncharacterized transport system substrate-binding protein